MLYACNLKEEEIATLTQPLFEPFKKWADSQQDANCCCISAKMEEELSELSDEDARNTWKPWESKIPGNFLIEASYELLGLASFLTAGKRSPGLTFRKDDRPNAGVIHRFEKAYQSRSGLLRRLDRSRLHAKAVMPASSLGRQGARVRRRGRRPLQMQCLKTALPPASSPLRLNTILPNLTIRLRIIYSFQ